MFPFIKMLSGNFLYKPPSDFAVQICLYRERSKPHNYVNFV